MLYIFCSLIHRHIYCQQLQTLKQDLIFLDDNVAFINGALILFEEDAFLKETFILIMGLIDLLRYRFRPI